MALDTGTKLGPYQIVAPVGAGGMGEVYRARDTRLDREVAIKVLTDTFARDPERVARFQREAKVLASLNHPNIAAIHGFEESDCKRFLVLELVEGDTLAERLRGALPVDQALEVCKQIAEALEAAHERGVIHRDLKPANIKVTLGGVVKVLDFGLAKALTEEPTESAPADSPTITANYTRPGVVLGTAPYMSPEQARGRPLDKRTDIWSFGIILYECLTGKRLFHGETATDSMGAIMHKEPDWSLLPPETPPTVQLLLRRCLTRNRKQRLQDIGDARVELEAAIADPTSSFLTLVGTALGPMRRAHPAIWGDALPWVASTLLALGLLLALWAPWRSPGSPRVTRFSVNLSSAEPLASSVLPWHSRVAISPEGRRLVYVGSRGGRRQLFLRELGAFETTPIAGTEDALNPFFSPDGDWVAFFDGGRLKKVSLTTKACVAVCDTLPVAGGGCWESADFILFTPNPNTGIARVSADGGSPQFVTTSDVEKGEDGHHFPKMLPGGKAMIFTIRERGGWDKTAVAVHSFETGEQRVLLKQGNSAHYASTGHLVYGWAGMLLAVPFDLEQLTVTGPPVQIVEGVITRTGSEFGVSDEGSLVYLPGQEMADRKLVWVDQKGLVEPLAANLRSYYYPRLSPNGRLLATILHSDAGNSDVYVYELDRSAWTRLTVNPDGDWNPVWTPDGERITYCSVRSTAPNLYWKPVDGGPAEGGPVLTRKYAQFPTSWSPDGKFLAFTDEHQETKFDVMLLPAEGEREPQPFACTEHNETAAMFSPDGRLIAYQSDESGRYEIYIRHFGSQGRRWTISTEGGTEPVWARDEQKMKLYYRNGDKMMVVDIKTEPDFAPSQPKLLFEERFNAGRLAADYDVTADGRFLMIQETPSTQIHVVLNWFEELKVNVPAETTR
jgi:serine/threonine protein kinase